MTHAHARPNILNSLNSTAAGTHSSSLSPSSSNPLAITHPLFFLIWTLPFTSLNRRHQLLIEQIFLFHPEAHVTIYSNTLRLEHFSWTRAYGYELRVQPYRWENFRSTFKMGHLGVDTWIDRIPEWSAKGGDSFDHHHLTEFLRLALMYHYGGTYLDFNIMLTHPLTYLYKAVVRFNRHTDTICDWCFPENDYLTSNMFLKFPPKSFFIHDLIIANFGTPETYDPRCRHCVGTRVLTKLAKSLVADPFALDGPRHTTADLHLLRSFAFQPMSPASLKQQFENRRDSYLTFSKVRRLAYGFYLPRSKISHFTLHRGSLLDRVIQDVRLTCHDDHKSSGEMNDEYGYADEDADQPSEVRHFNLNQFQIYRPDLLARIQRELDSNTNWANRHTILPSPRISAPSFLGIRHRRQPFPLGHIRITDCLNRIHVGTHSTAQSSSTTAPSSPSSSSGSIPASGIDVLPNLVIDVGLHDVVESPTYTLMIEIAHGGLVNLAPFIISRNIDSAAMAALSKAERELQHPAVNIMAIRGTFHHVNTQLSSLVYLPRHHENFTSHDNVIDLVLTASYPSGTIKGIPSSVGPITLSHRWSIRLYEPSSCVTLCSKTHGRMNLIDSLLLSVHRDFPELPAIVSDDSHSAYTQGPSFHSPYVTYLPFPFDTGLSEGRNLMLQHVRTKYFVIVDDDFVFLPGDTDLDFLLHAMEHSHRIRRSQEHEYAKARQEAARAITSVYVPPKRTHVRPQPPSFQPFDIVAMKNPADQARWNFDFCGTMSESRDNQTLILESGSYGPTTLGCDVVDIVPNLFLGSTRRVQIVGWDSRLKLGEHEDFFWRAKAYGLKVATCSSVWIRHQQTVHWLPSTAYDHSRSRIKKFWNIMLAKNNWRCFQSFGQLVQCRDPSQEFDLDEAICSLGWSSSDRRHCDICSDGFTGPNCDECVPGHFGTQCLKCWCHGDGGDYDSCSDGRLGDGQCRCKCPLEYSKNFVSNSRFDPRTKEQQQQREPTSITMPLHNPPWRWAVYTEKKSQGYFELVPVTQDVQMNPQSKLQQMAALFEPDDDGSIPSYDTNSVPTTTFDPTVISSYAVGVSNPSNEHVTGIIQRTIVGKFRPMTLTVSVFVAGYDITGSNDAGFSLYTDVKYTDGSEDWGLFEPFPVGTYNWTLVERQFNYPRPVASVTLYIMMRWHAGTALITQPRIRQSVCDCSPRIPTINTTTLATTATHAPNPTQTPESTTESQPQPSVPTPTPTP